MKPNSSAAPVHPEGARDMSNGTANGDRELVMAVQVICAGQIDWTRLLEAFANEPIPHEDLSWSRSWLEQRLARKLIDALTVMYSDRQGFSQQLDQIVTKLIDGPSLPPLLLAELEDGS